MFTPLGSTRPLSKIAARRIRTTFSCMPEGTRRRRRQWRQRTREPYSTPPLPLPVALARAPRRSSTTPKASNAPPSSAQTRRRDVARGRATPSSARHQESRRTPTRCRRTRTDRSPLPNNSRVQLRATDRRRGMRRMAPSWLAHALRLARSLVRCNPLLGSVHADESRSAPQNLHVTIKFGSESIQLNRQIVRDLQVQPEPGRVSEEAPES